MHENVFYVEMGYYLKGKGEKVEKVFRQGFYFI